MRRLGTAAAALVLAGSLSAGALAVEGKTARIAIQNSSGVTLYCSLDSAARTITVRRARFKGAVELETGNTALYVGPEAKYSVTLPGSPERAAFDAGAAKPVIVILTRVRAGKVDRIEAAFKGAAETEVKGASEAERAELAEKLKGESSKDTKQPKRVPTTEELMPLISNWTHHEKWNWDLDRDRERRRAQRIDELERLLWARYCALPYYPRYEDPDYGWGWRSSRTRRPRRGLVVDDPGPVSYDNPRLVSFYRRYRPAVVVRADDWRLSDGSLFVRHAIGDADLWLRWDW